MLFANVLTEFKIAPHHTAQFFMAISNQYKLAGFRIISEVFRRCVFLVIAYLVATRHILFLHLS